MTHRAWYSQDRDFAPGAELYRSDRKFSFWTHTASHGQTLLRSLPDTCSADSGHDTRVDILFKPTTLMKIRSWYNGLAIRYATAEEANGIRSQVPGMSFGSRYRFFVLESAGDLDYVVAMALGWHEDHGDIGPSAFAGLDESANAPWAPGPRALFGVDGGINNQVAPLEGLLSALTAETQDGLDRARHRHRHVYLVAARFPSPEDEGTRIVNLGAFLTRAEAEAAQRWLATRHSHSDSWIEMLPVPL